MRIDLLPGTRRALLTSLKFDGPSSIADLATRLGTTGEAVRQQLVLLCDEGWVTSERAPSRGKTGRPAAHYRLTDAGDHLFPKCYDTLAREMVEAIANTLGQEALDRVLAARVESLVAKWSPKLEGLTFVEKVETLTSFYQANDPFMSTAHFADRSELVERNCPFLNVAMARPELCGVTLTVLERLLGVRVTREKCFQRGDGCCLFQIKTREARNGTVEKRGTR